MRKSKYVLVAYLGGAALIIRVKSYGATKCSMINPIKFLRLFALEKHDAKEEITR